MAGRGRGSNIIGARRNQPTGAHHAKRKSRNTPPRGAEGFVGRVEQEIIECHLKGIGWRRFQVRVFGVSTKRDLLNIFPPEAVCFRTILFDAGAILFFLCHADAFRLHG